MKEIVLSQGYVALVDDADYEAVCQFNWFAARRGKVFYARRNTWDSFTHRAGGQLLHSFLLPEVRSIDHRDGNGLNCQRYNLRQANKMQNAQAFQNKKAGATSVYRGVSWDRERQQWASEIKVCRKKKFLGRFDAEQDAARAYDDAARKYFGEFASPNFP